MPIDILGFYIYFKIYVLFLLGSSAPTLNYEIFLFSYTYLFAASLSDRF